MIGTLVVGLMNLCRALQNGWRRLLRRRVDYVRIEISGSMPEFADQPQWWQRRFLGASAPPSLWGLRRQLQQIASDPQVAGVLLVINDSAVGWATAASLRDAIHTFRSCGKRAVAYLPGADTRTYFIACAADTVLMPPTASLNLLGIRVEAQFLRDALRLVGIEAEVVAVSPYKTGADQFARADMSAENREQLDRLLDQRYAMIVSAIAGDRGITEARVRELIDQAPFFAPAAHGAALIDGTCYEDELERWLTGEIGDQPAAVSDRSSESQGSHRSSLRILDWPAAAKALRLPYLVRQRSYVAVVSVAGPITSGASRNIPLPLPLIGGAVAGSDSIAQALRRVERNKRIAALVLHIDSPGGDAFASDLIWREVLRVRRQKPVVISMGNVAASGGYYIAACASTIVAHPATLTGSIGVYSLRPIACNLLEQAHVNTVVLSRGARAGLLSPVQPPTDDERTVMQQTVFTIYEEFKQRVRSGRHLTEEQLMPIAGGRVWTGDEARRLGLVDVLGGLPTAIARARELASLPPDPAAPILRVLTAGGGHLLPRPFPAGDTLAALPDLLGEALRPRILATMPWVIKD